jgi:dipeptidyl aminopeptidase/acylaminoacyl peptidase
MPRESAGSRGAQNGTIIERTALDIPAELFMPGSADLLRDHSCLAQVEIDQIVYSSDGLAIRGFIAKPRKAGPHPCVIYNRGGNRDFAAISPVVAASLLGRIASWGYVVAASQYRGTTGSEGVDQFGGEDVDDVMNLIPLLESEQGADTSRIGMFGGSRGGMMTYLALTKTDRIKAAVVRCGVSDLTGWADERRDMEAVYRELIPGFSPDDDSPLVRRSAVYWPEKLCKSTPILLLQGTADWRVNPRSALRFAEALLAAQHPFRLVMLEGSDHALTEHIPERDRQTREWLDRFVRDCAPLPRIEPHGD